MSSNSALPVPIKPVPAVPSLNLSALKKFRSDENASPSVGRTMRPEHDSIAHLTSAVSAAAARGLDSALLKSWGKTNESAVAPHPPVTAADAAAGPIGRRSLLNHTGSSRFSSDGIADLTLAAATPLADSFSGANPFPIADVNTLAKLIGFSTPRSCTASQKKSHRSRAVSHSATKQCSAGSSSERRSASKSSLLPQFSKGFSLYMRRWQPSYYYGSSTEESPSQVESVGPPHEAPQRRKAIITGASYQSIWSAAAEAAKSKIASIEAEHERRRALSSEAKIMQVSFQLNILNVVAFALELCFCFCVCDAAFN
jgi:hypothetical protein